MAESAESKDAGSGEDQMERREFVRKLAKKAVWIAPAILTLKARTAFAVTVAPGVALSI